MPTVAKPELNADKLCSACTYVECGKSRFGVKGFACTEECQYHKELRAEQLPALQAHEEQMKLENMIAEKMQANARAIAVEDLKKEGKLDAEGKMVK